MKELSIEEKAARYDRSLERARDVHTYYCDDREQLKKIEHIFPELKESEDDKTKRILHSISSKISFHLRDIFTEEEFQCFDTWSNSWLEKQGEQKPTWSEEDEKHLKLAIDNFQTLGNSFLTAWLKSLKDRVQPQQEWSKEDTEHLNSIYATLKEKANERPFDMPSYYDKQIEWLKSLVPQSQWKPSEEQMFDLKCAADSNSNVLLGQSLLSLYNDLKKLKG